MTAPSDARPLAVPAFRWLMAGQLVSAIGDQVFPVAVAALIVGRGGTAAQLGIVLAARVAALVIFSLLGGVWADRLPRVAVLRAADLLRLVAVAVLAVFSASSRPSIGVLAALVFVVGAGEAFFRPAYGALLPTVLPESSLAAGNSLSVAGHHVALIAGPGLAGLLLLVTGPPMIFAFDALTFAVSFATLLRVTEPAYQPEPRRRMAHEMAEGFAAVRSRPWVAAVFAMASVQLLLTVAPATVLLPLVLRDLGASESAYGLVLAVGAVGGLLGALLAGRFEPAHPGRVGLLGIIAFAVLPLAMLAGASAVLLAAASFVASAGIGPFNVWWDTALQRAVPRDLLARVVSLDWMLSLSLLPLGFALTGPAVAVFGQGPVLVSAVGSMVVTSLLPLWVPGVRDFRDPVPPD